MSSAVEPIEHEGDERTWPVGVALLVASLASIYLWAQAIALIVHGYGWVVPAIAAVLTIAAFTKHGRWNGHGKGDRDDDKS